MAQSSHPVEDVRKRSSRKRSEKPVVEEEVHDRQAATDAASTSASSDKESETGCESASGAELVSSYRVSPETVKILADRGIRTLFPIQQKTFDAVYDGKHVIGRARTGTGKTLAFALPSFEALLEEGKLKKRGCRLLALLPTRELAQQVAVEFENLIGSRTFIGRPQPTNHRGGFGFNSGDAAVAPIVGGLPEEPQLRLLDGGAPFVVGTPGRVLDFLERGRLQLKKLRVLVLDEADQMLEMGFKEDVDRILAFIAEARGKATTDAQPSPQILLFTATLPAWVTQIARTYMESRPGAPGAREVVTVDVVKGEAQTTAKGIRHLSILCGFHQRALVLADVLALYAPSTNGRCIVFTETKANANAVAVDSGISHLCQVLHGDIPQKQREVTLKAFKEGKFRCLVATDVAARGIHVDNVELVVQLEPPKDVDTFVHRAGRTGRAGAAGTNVLFFRAMDAPFLATIEQATGMKFTRVAVPQASAMIARAAEQKAEALIKESRPSASRLEMLKKCEEAATSLISALGPKEAVSRLLLALVGYSSADAGQSCYSALSGTEGYRTYQVDLHTTKISAKNYVWQLLKTRLGMDQEILNQFSSMTLRADGKGALFDVPQAHLAAFEKHLEDAFANNSQNQEAFSISVATELPELIDPRLDASFQGQISSDMRNPMSRNTKRRRDDRGGRQGSGNGYGGGGPANKWPRRSGTGGGFGGRGGHHY